MGAACCRRRWSALVLIKWTREQCCDQVLANTSRHLTNVGLRTSQRASSGFSTEVRAVGPEQSPSRRDSCNH